MGKGAPLNRRNATSHLAHDAMSQVRWRSDKGNGQHGFLRLLSAVCRWPRRFVLRLRAIHEGPAPARQFSKARTGWSTGLPLRTTGNMPRFALSEVVLLGIPNRSPSHGRHAQGVLNVFLSKVERCCRPSDAASRVIEKMAWVQGKSRRGRMGVEPTSEGSTPTHTILKIGEATGPHPPPGGRRV